MIETDIAEIEHYVEIVKQDTDIQKSEKKEFGKREFAMGDCIEKE